MDDRHIYPTYINTCNVLVIVIQNASHRAYKNQVQLFNIVKHINFTRCLHVAGCVIEGGITIEACLYKLNKTNCKRYNCQYKHYEQLNYDLNYSFPKFSEFTTIVVEHD